MLRLDDIQNCGPRTIVSSDVDMHKTLFKSGRTSERQDDSPGNSKKKIIS